jgi:hypothetical protein
MSENRRQILDMLAEGKISVDEAERLLALVEQPAGGEAGRGETSDARKPSPKYLRIVVEPESQGGAEEGGERVNIRVPMALIRAGVKLASIIPSKATNSVNEALDKRGLGADLRNLKPEDLEQLVDALSDLEVDVQGGKEKVRIYVE